MVRCDILKKARALLLELRFSHVLTSHCRCSPSGVTSWELFSSWNIVFSLLKIFSLLPLWPTSVSAFMCFFKSKCLLAHLLWMLLSLIQEPFINLRCSLGVNYLDGQMWSCWQWLLLFICTPFSEQSDRISFENFLNPLEDSENTSRIVKDPIVTQQPSSALIRFFLVNSFDLR